MDQSHLPKPQGRDERRRVKREEGLNLLFAAAQDVAREEGKLADGVYGSLEQSRISATSFTLVSASGQLIARVSLAKTREVMGMRRQIARDMTRKAGLEITPYANDQSNKRNFFTLPDKVRALAWAISNGRRFPVKGYQRRDIWIGLLLLIPGIIPGVLYLGWIALKRWRYEKNLKELVARWVTKGRPNPAQNLFAHFHLD
jgi:hypothetical protein